MGDYRTILAAPAYGSTRCDPPPWCWRQRTGSSSLYCRRPVNDLELGLCPRCVAELRGDNPVVRLWRKAVA